MSREDLENQEVEDSVDSASSASLTGNNNNNVPRGGAVVKMGPLFAELYYKQLLALTKPRLAAAARTTLSSSPLALDQVSPLTTTMFHSQIFKRMIICV